MRAAVLEKFGEPLILTNVSDPQPGAGEVRVRVRAIGMCGTDLKVISGAFPISLPLIPGHEVAGDIVAVGGGVSDRRVGERVACYYYSTCEICFFCRKGQENLCLRVRRLGFERNGGLAQEMTLPANCALPLPEEVTYEQAAIAMDAVTTPWRALRKRFRVDPGEHVAIIGAGGLGLHAGQIARLEGAQVAGIEPSQERRDRAIHVGFDMAVAPPEADRVREWADGYVDLCVEVSGTQEGLDLAVALVRPGGRVGVIGYREGVQLRMPSRQLVLGETVIVGSRGGSLNDAAEVLGVIAEGKLKAEIAGTLALDEVNLAFERLVRGDFVGRLVVVP